VAVKAPSVIVILCQPFHLLMMILRLGMVMGQRKTGIWKDLIQNRPLRSRRTLGSKSIDIWTGGG